MKENEKPRIQIGWLTIGTTGVPWEGQCPAEKLRIRLENQMPAFDWGMERIEIPLGHRTGPVDPLELLARGVQEKVEHHWDFALVVTDAELLARERPFIFGVPSSALETAVMSRARISIKERTDEHVLALAQFLLGSLLGLDPSDEGAMRRPHARNDMALQRFSVEEIRKLELRLADVGDERLEEQTRRWNRLSFGWRTLAADPRGILRDIIGYRPWRQPFRLGKLTAASFVSVLLMFLGAEAWELGSSAQPPLLISAGIVSIGASAWFLYRGQNLSELSRGVGLTEQVVRSQLVLWWCLLVGVLSLWAFLFVTSFVIAGALPKEQIETWLAKPLDLGMRIRFAAFISSLGTLAGGLGGNLEEEKSFKARFLFDEEI